VDRVVGLRRDASNGKREAPCAMAVEPFRKAVPMTAAPEPKASTPPRKPRREIARSTTRSKS
jgi:hypothetical protein